MNPEQPSVKLRLLLIGIFVLDFMFLVGGWTLTHYDYQYDLIQDIASTMLLGALIISFIISALACMRFSFGFSFKKSALLTALLMLLGFAIYSIGGHVISSY
jgi:hypothetical protein